MPDSIGIVPVPEIVPSGTFPLVPDYPYGIARVPEVVIHSFGSGNAKIEQRFLFDTGTRQFTIRKVWLRDSERIALRNFWETKYGPYGAFTYNAPNADRTGITPVICRFANEPLTWEMVSDWACSLGVTLIEIPTTTPTYPVNQTVHRFPPAALQNALLSQVQEIIPLVRIHPLEPGNPAIHRSERRCIIGSQLYQARLLEFEGISQGMGNESDEAQFRFGNADRATHALADDVDPLRAELAFSLFHVGAGIQFDLWKGNIGNWAADYATNFHANSPAKVNNYTSMLIDGRLRILSGEQVDLIVEGIIGIESDAIPAVFLRQPASIRDIYACCRTALQDRNITAVVKVGGTPIATVTINDGQNFPANTVDGKDLPAIPPTEPITLDVTGVGLTYPGERLVVTIRM